MHHLYILLCDKAFFYTGITNNLDRRVKEHKSHLSPHTKRYLEVELVYFEKFPSHYLAEKREKQIKGWSKAKKKALVGGNLDKLIALSKSKS